MDFDFTASLEGVSLTTASVACRLAVLWPLVGRPSKRPGGDYRDAIVNGLAKLREQWHARLIQLCQNGWQIQADATDSAVPADERFSVARSRQYLRNCPPFGVVTSVHAMCCRRTRVCPFCYARERVMEAYRSLEFALYGINDAVELSLVGIRQRYVDRPHNGDFADCVRIASSARQLAYEVLEKALPCNSILGARLGSMIEPGTTPGTIAINRICVAVVRADLKNFPDTLSNTKLFFHKNPTRRQLAEVVGRCFAYPVGMMRNDVEAAVALLNVTKKTRFAGGVGICENAAFRGALRGPKE